jgi:hypothetical protein
VDEVDERQLVCVHCENPVVLINYGDAPQKMRGELYNKYKHGYPRPYPICNVNPIMDEDVKDLDET